MLRSRALLPALLLTLVLPLVVTPQRAEAAGVDWEGVIDITFPVVGDDHRYVDDYHQPRSRGAHGATDIMAPAGTPVVAARGGTIAWTSTPTTSRCGYCLRIDGDDCRSYSYIHLGPKEAGAAEQAFAQDWRRGDEVGRGEVIGYVGCSGNASCSPGGHHLHFVIADPGVTDPYGDHRRNPYPSLRAAEARSSTTTCAPSASFDDVCAGSRHERDIERLSAASLTAGCGTRRFCPTEPVTREQMASFIIRALGLGGLDRTPFTDVSTTNIHHRTIARLAERGITKGCSEDRYCPADGVTRAQMASFLVRAKGLTPADTPTFADVPATNRHRRDIAALAASGITVGCGAENFCPDRVVTRREMASFLVRAFVD